MPDFPLDVDVPSVSLPAYVFWYLSISTLAHHPCHMQYNVCLTTMVHQGCREINYAE